jgi:hypothetical protein
MELISAMRDFIRDYKLMAIRPRRGKAPLLKGRFDFHAHHPQLGEVEDSFDIEIDVPETFPKALPVVTETAKKIPRDQAFHVNSDDTLCLGSPLRLLLLVSENPTLTGFAEKCLVPYLFAVSLKLKTGEDLAFGELAHGAPGALDDYVSLFGLKAHDEALQVLLLLGKKKRIANKQRCPCGCRLRLGKCKFNCRLAPFRNLASRSWYREQHQDMLLMLEFAQRRMRNALNLAVHRPSPSQLVVTPNRE